MIDLHTEVALAFEMAFGDVRGELLPDRSVPLMPREFEAFSQAFCGRIFALLETREVAR